MALVILLVFKLTRSAATGDPSIQTRGIKAQTKINSLVTAAHVVLILAYTGLSILIYNVPRFDGADSTNVAVYRVTTAWGLFGGL
jgi:hypothetical protein